MYNLIFRWTVSRGRETYGYNICSLWMNGVKVSSCNGGGYDMEGTAFAQWIEGAFQDELVELAPRAHGAYAVDARGKYVARLDAWKPEKGTPGFYGMTARMDGSTGAVHSVALDGGCGFDCIRAIVKAIGYGLRSVDNGRKHTTYIMAELDVVDALHKSKGVHITHYRDMAHVRAANAASGRHWFEPATLRFFESRPGRTLYGGRYFISSEQFVPSSGPSAARRYTVREVTPDASIGTAGEFQAHDTHGAARQAVRDLLAPVSAV